MRLLHTADLHLDAPFAGRSRPVQDRLHEALRRALERMVDLAIDRRVHAFVIAGDLLDSGRLSFTTERFLLQQVGRLGDAGVAVLYAAGNHDPGGGRPRSRPIKWPAHVTVFSGSEPRRVPIFDREGRTVGFVTGAGHPTDRETSDLSLAFERPPGLLPEVAVLHTHAGSASSSDRHRRYAPSHVARLASAGFDYWALGHVHQYQVLNHHPVVCYPGSPQGLGYGEVGPHGCVLVDLSARQTPDIHFHPVAPIRFEVLVVDGLGQARSFDAIVRSVVQAWKAARESDPVEGDAEWILRVDLEGPAALAPLLRREEDLEALRVELVAALDALHVDVRADRTHAPVRIEDYANRGDVLSEALGLVAELYEDNELLNSVAPELAGFDVASGRERDEYLAALLDGAREELLTRLLRDEESA